MTRTSLSVWTLTLLALAGGKSALAAAVTYTIDPQQSSLLAFGTLSDNIPSAQTFGSNLTTYSGTISADRTAGSIQFIFGSAIDAAPQPTRQRPDIGGEDGSATADYGLVAPNMFAETDAAFRDLVFDLSSDALTVAANGNFDGSFDVIYASGSVDWNAGSGSQWDNVDFTGRTLFNQSPNTPSIVSADGVETLTLPLRFSTIFSTEHSGDSTLRLSGNLVATRSIGGQPQWIKDGGGSWGDPANWDGGIPNSPTASANFLGALTQPNAPAIIKLDGDRTAGTLAFDNENTYEITQGISGALTLGDSQNPGSIKVDAGHHRISAPLLLAANTTAQLAPGTTLNFAGPSTISDNQTLTTTGGGLLLISGPQDHGQGASLNVAGAQVSLNSNAGHPGGGPVAPRSNLTLSIGGASSHVVLGADQDLQSLGVNYESADLQGLDLNTPPESGAFRSVRIHIPSDAQQQMKQRLYSAIGNARSNPGDGIFDSGLAAHPASTIGIAFVDDPRGSQYLLIRPTRLGDLNLDGIVTISDFLDLASNFNSTGATWQEGDLNHDMVVTISDFLDLASNFGMSYAGSSTPIDSAEMAVLEDFASTHGLTLVPEPGVMTGMMICLGALITRRARRR